MGKPPLRLLIVEDEVAHAAAIQRAFQTDEPETQIEVVGTLREFHQHSADHPPDLALLDLNLPDGRAVEILSSPPEAGPGARRSTSWPQSGVCCWPCRNDP